MDCCRGQQGVLRAASATQRELSIRGEVLRGNASEPRSTVLLSLLENPQSAIKGFRTRALCFDAPNSVQSNTLSTELHLRNTNAPTVQCPIATPNTHIHEFVVASTHPVSELPYAPGSVEIVLLSPQTIPASPGAISIMFAWTIENHQSVNSRVRPDTIEAMSNDAETTNDIQDT